MNRWLLQPKHIGILIGLFILVVLVMDFNNRLEGLNRLSTQVATVRVRGTAVAQTQSAFVTKIAYATSNEAVEEFARENGMMQEGDNPVQLIPAETPTQTPYPLPPPPTPRPANWQIWWELFFGD